MAKTPYKHVKKKGETLRITKNIIPSHTPITYKEKPNTWNQDSQKCWKWHNTSQQPQKNQGGKKKKQTHRLKKSQQKYKQRNKNGNMKLMLLVIQTQHFNSKETTTSKITKTT
jgi:hypothetical protein